MGASTAMSGLDGWRTRPAYSIPEAARLANTSSITVRRWLYGDERPGRQMAPVFGHKTREEKQGAEVSFLQLAEILVVAAFRRRNIRLQRLRHAHAYTKQLLRIDYPFAWAKLQTDGAHVLLKFQGGEPGPQLLALDEHGQWALPGDVVKVLKDFDFEFDFATRWFPLGKSIPVVVDPRFAAGKATILNSGVTIETLYKRWEAGQGIGIIAYDYKLSRQVVESALRHAKSLAA